MTNIKKRELSNASRSSSNSALFLIVVYYFHMNIQETKVKGLPESRFGSMIFIFRMAGIPFKMKKISTIYAMYMITVILCASTTYLGLYVEVYTHREDLGLTMTTMRVLLTVTYVVWIFSYCR